MQELGCVGPECVRLHVPARFGIGVRHHECDLGSSADKRFSFPVPIGFIVAFAPHKPVASGKRWRVPRLIALEALNPLLILSWKTAVRMT